MTGEIALGNSAVADCQETEVYRDIQITGLFGESLLGPVRVTLLMVNIVMHCKIVRSSGSELRCTRPIREVLFKTHVIWYISL